MLASLSGFYYLFFNVGYFIESLRLLTIALESLPIVEPSPLETRLRAALLAQQGEFFFHIGRYSEGLPVLEEAVSLLQTLNTPDRLADVLRLLANLVGAMGSYDRAIELLQQGLAMITETSDPYLRFNLLNRAGVMAYFKKDFEQSMAYFQQTLVIARQINDPGKIAVSLNNQGDVALHTGDPTAARRLLREGLALCRESGQTTLNASVLSLLARAEFTLHDIPTACACFAEALRLVQEIDAAPLALEILVGVAEMWFIAAGQTAQARELLQYILKYRTIPNNIRQWAQALEAQMEGQPVVCRWQDRPIRWVVIDVIEMLTPGNG